MVSIIKKLLYLIFGEWNGLQNFVAPSVLIYMFERQSFFHWFVNLLTYQIFYLPVVLYITVLIFVGFMMLKAAVQWKNIVCKRTGKLHGKLGRDLLLPLFIKMHHWLFSILVLLMLVYVLRNGYAYFYKNHVSMYKIYFWIVRLSTAFFCFYIYMLLDVAVPLIKNGHSLRRAERFLRSYFFCRPAQALLLYGVQFILIFLTIYIFRYAVQIIDSFNESGLLFNSPMPVRTVFKDARTLGQMISNFAILPLAYIFSNLLYSPLMFILKLGFEHAKISPIHHQDYAAKKKNCQTTR